MEDLIKILTKLTTDFGINILENPQRFKSAFTDYSEGEFRGERELLIKIIEIGSFNTITNAEDLSIAKKVLVKRLCDEYFLNENVCSDIVNIYTSLLREDNVKTEKIEIPEIETPTAITDVPNVPISSMQHIISTVNSCSFDVPIFQGNNLLNLNEKNFIISSYEGGNGSYAYFLRRNKQGYRPHLFSKKIESISAYIAKIFKSIGNPFLESQKKIEINGISAECYQFQKDQYFTQYAFLETKGFFYHFGISVPLKEKSQYQEQMDTFIYSIKLN